MAQEGWERNLTRSVAAQVRRYRQQRQLSTQALSDRCAELGMSIPRPVLSNLETGRRESVTLAELIVLALALDVPPALLVVPVTTEEKTELLPGREVDSEEALGWLAGQTRLMPVDSRLEAKIRASDDGTNELVSAYLHHQNLADIVLWTKPRLTPEDLRTAVEDDQGGPGELKAVRRFLREMGVRLPPLPPELAAIDPPELSREQLSNRMRHAVRRP